MSRTVFSAAFVTFGLLILATLGCGDAGGLDAQQLAAYRTELTLEDEPDGIQTVADVRLTLLGEEPTAHDDHDHDGDGVPDHAPEDHDAHEESEHAHDEADHDEEGHDEEGHAHEEEADEHAGHDHDEHAHEEHDGEGKHDHSAEDHDEHAHDNDHDHAHEHGHETEPQDVVMVGHIGGLANPWGESHPDYPFAKTEAVFFLADPQAVIANEEAGHKHAPGEECAFCAAHAADQADMLAMVRFVDEKGKVLRTDARKLFDVKEQDTVVVSGTARVTAGGILVVDARGLYVRK